MGKKKIKHLGKKRRKNKSIGGFIKKTIILLGTFISLITFIYLDKHIKELYKGVNIEESAIEFYIDMADEIGNKEVQLSWQELKYLEELKGSYLAKDTLKNQDEKIKFIKKVSELSYENYEKYKILPSITVGQAILESRWGESDLSKNSNNIFGVKADARWNGKVVEVNTSENYDDKIVAKFRKYDSIKDSINDLGKFLTENKRYEESTRD